VIAADATPITWVFEPGTFAPLAKEIAGQRFGMVTDHLGTPRMLADEAGALAWKAQLDAYGIAQSDVARTPCPWRWPGQYEDEETGLSYNRFRYYDPATGRFVSQDPVGLEGGLNAYRYVIDPLSWVDPLGLTEERGLWDLTAEMTDLKRTLGSHTYWRHKTTGLWWSRDTAGHGGVAFKVMAEGAGGVLNWFRDADKYGDFIDPNKKHKGPVGKRVCGK
jgi:RHS repeat-associated protein